MNYLELLQRLHDGLRPEAYLEIGVDWGNTLALSRSFTVAIDPAPRPRPETLRGKPGLLLAADPSDAFFARYQPEGVLGGARLDLAFIDGLHEFAQVVRDLQNVERWGHAGTVAVIHDVLPRTPWEATHAFHDGFWTGDVWRVVPFLRRHRPDLRCRLTAADPTGVLIVTGFNPAHPGMAEVAEAIDRDYPPDGPEYEALAAAFIAEATPETPEAVLHSLGIGDQEDAWAYDTKWGMRLVAERSWRPVLREAAEGAAAGRWESGMRACLRLIGAHWLPENVRAEAYRHLVDYARSLADLWPDATWRPLTLPVPEVGGAAAATAPAPAVVGERLVAAARTGVPGATSGWSLIDFDADLEATAATPLAGPGDRLMPFAHGDALWAIVANGAGDPGVQAHTQVALASMTNGAVGPMHQLGDARDQRGRTWVPLPSEAALDLVTGWEPTEVRRVDPATGALGRRSLRPAPRLAERFEGGSAAVPVPGGALVLVNERTRVDDGDLLVFARFALLDAEHRIAAVSPHVWVAARGRDEASGLARHGDDLVAGFTSNDETGLLACLPVAAVLDALIPLEAAG